MSAPGAPNAPADYQMKDLGYPRTPTTAVLRVEMGDGSRWDVPAQVIVDDRDAHYSDEREDTVLYIREGSMPAVEIREWGTSNMNWSDVVAFTRPAPPRVVKIDWEDGWVNGEKEIVGKV